MNIPERGRLFGIEWIAYIGTYAAGFGWNNSNSGCVYTIHIGSHGGYSTRNVPSPRSELFKYPVPAVNDPCRTMIPEFVSEKFALWPRVFYGKSRQETTDLGERPGGNCEKWGRLKPPGRVTKKYRFEIHPDGNAINSLFTLAHVLKPIPVHLLTLYHCSMIHRGLLRTKRRKKAVSSVHFSWVLQTVLPENKGRVNKMTDRCFR